MSIIYTFSKLIVNNYLNSICAAIEMHKIAYQSQLPLQFHGFMPSQMTVSAPIG